MLGTWDMHMLVFLCGTSGIALGRSRCTQLRIWVPLAYLFLFSPSLLHHLMATAATKAKASALKMASRISS